MSHLNLLDGKKNLRFSLTFRRASGILGARLKQQPQPKNRSSYMSRQANQSNNYAFRVVQLQLRHPVTNVPLANQFGNFRDDTGQCLGTTSEQYGIIQNADLLDYARSALAAKGLTGYTEKIIVAGDAGQRFYARFEFRHRELASAVGDKFGYVLELRNSHDRTLRAAIMLGLLRLTCLNGAATLEKEFAVTRKHSTKVTVEFLGEAIDNAMANGQKALKVYDEMAQIALPNELGVNVLNHLVEDSTLSASMAQNIRFLWLAPRRDEDKARNLWSLYNAVTEHLTHQVEDKRFEYAGKVNTSVLFQFANAARKPERLAKLVAPIIDVSAVAA